jgi:hypothetical protein
VHLALDADAAGEASTAAACRCAWEAALDVAVLAMPPGCKDPDEVLARHGATAGAQQLFALDRGEPGATWLARYQLHRCPPVTVEQAAALRDASAESARLMPGSARTSYGEIMAEALGVPARILEVDWERQHDGTGDARFVTPLGARLGRPARTDLLAEHPTGVALIRASRAGTSMEYRLCGSAAPARPRRGLATPAAQLDLGGLMAGDRRVGVPSLWRRLRHDDPIAVRRSSPPGRPAGPGLGLPAGRARPSRPDLQLTFPGRSPTEDRSPRVHRGGSGQPRLLPSRVTTPASEARPGPPGAVSLAPGAAPLTLPGPVAPHRGGAGLVRQPPWGATEKGLYVAYPPWA